jgi:PilZ domain
MGQMIRGSAFETQGTGTARREPPTSTPTALESTAPAAAQANDNASPAPRAPHEHRLGQHDRQERRHSFRVRVSASASLWHRGQFAGHYQVIDLSLGGCLLEGKALPESEEPFDLVLHTPLRPPLVFHARLRRSGPHLQALRFDKLTPVIEDALQDLIVETYALVRTREAELALVVEPRHAERHTLVRTLRELGRRAVGVATALDAVQLLVEEGERVHTVFIEAESEVVPSLELIEFLMHNHPGVKRVLIGEPRAIARHWLEETAGEVHAVLECTSDHEAVNRVLRKLDRTPVAQEA